MPTYLCHGFRWHRRSIRYFVAIQDLDDGAPEWIVAPRSAVAFLESFYDLFDFLPPCVPAVNPTRVANHNHQLSNASQSTGSQEPEYEDEQRNGRRTDDGKKSKRGRSLSHKRSKSKSRQTKAERRDETPTAHPPLPSVPPPNDENMTFNDWSVVKMLEEFDPSNESLLNGPWAYIADYVVRVDTSIPCLDEVIRYEERMKVDKDKAMSGPSDETGRKVNTVGSKKAGWLEKLRDQLQRGEDIRWYVVVCGDEERDKGENIEHSSDRSSERGGARDTPTPRGYTEDDGEDDSDFRFRIPDLAQFNPPPPLELPTRSIERIPPTVPEKDDPPMSAIQSPNDTMDSQQRPKTPKTSGGIRRLFSKRTPNELLRTA